MAIFIFRRDFRIQDNIGFNNCCLENNIVYPIFIFTPEQVTNNPFKSSNAVQFMVDSIKELNKMLNNKLNIYYGNNETVIKYILKTFGPLKLYSNTDYTNYAINRDLNLKKYNIKLYHDICLFEIGTIKNKSGEPYKKFTPFYNYVINNYEIPKPKYIKIKSKFAKLPETKYNVHDLDKFYTYNENVYIKGGRSNALELLKNIKIPSRLSPFIKFGCISIREAATKKIILRGLLWRDFYYNIGGDLGQPMKDEYQNIKWNNNDEYINSWINGQTGFPYIDACMRELNTTGYLENRGRMNVACFLVKVLGCNWVIGEQHFSKLLVDYDPLVNLGNWNWINGSGTDSMPYFRVFNPWTQQKKYDKNCDYIKKWIPELKNVSNKDIHNWDIFYKNYDVYYEPIVDYKKAKAKVYEMYKKYV